LIDYFNQKGFKQYTTMKKSGFTLIELLIVIGLLAALAAVLLPSLMGDRQTATESICNYNQAGTLRTLRQYEAMTSGKLPSGLHTGLTDDDTTPVYMPGLPGGFTGNLTGTYTTPLSGPEAAALVNAGIANLAYGTGKPDATDVNTSLGYKPVVKDLVVMEVSENWIDDAKIPYSFNGKGIAALHSDGYETVIALFIAPTTDWSASESKGWVKNFSVKLDVPGKCPVPVDADFAYYVAYVGLKTTGYDVSYSVETGQTLPGGLPTWQKTNSYSLPDTITDYVYEDEKIYKGTAVATGTLVGTVTLTPIGTNDGDIEPKAVLLGTSCPECGITNP
jgi:prepilin-type N-terminal cleavage/methylation domain-containing protein